MKMKLPSVDKLRIPILLALAVGEAIGLHHSYGKPEFFQFIVLSIVVIMVLVPLLWLDLIRRIKVTLPQVIVVPLAFSWLSNSLKHDERGLAIVWAFVLLADISSILIRLYITSRQQQKTQGGRA